MKPQNKRNAISKVANNLKYDAKYKLGDSLDGDEIAEEGEKTLNAGGETKRNRITKRLQEIYAGRYGYRKTASGKWRANDEPNEKEQFRQADAINKTMQQRKSAASRDRLKKADKVPTRVATGKKLFDEFMREAYEKTGKQRSAGNQEDLKQVYLAARALEFDKFLIFLTDVL